MILFTSSMQQSEGVKLINSHSVKSVQNFWCSLEVSDDEHLISVSVEELWVVSDFPKLQER